MLSWLLAKRGIEMRAIRRVYRIVVYVEPQIVNRNIICERESLGACANLLSDMLGT